MPCIPLGHVDNLRKCIDAKLGVLCVFSLVRIVAATAATAASSGFSPGVVKVLVSFYRSGEDSAFERRRSRVTFDLSKQFSVAAVKKHLREFLGLNELALYFSDFSLENFGSLRTFSVVFGNLRKSSEMIGNRRKVAENLLIYWKKEHCPFWRRFCFLLHKIYCYRAKKLTVYRYRGTPFRPSTQERVKFYCNHTGGFTVDF